MLTIAMESADQSGINNFSPVISCAIF